MENIKYFEDNGSILAYDRSTEFFVIYMPAANEWRDCDRSFMEFRHSYSFKEINPGDAMSRTNGCSPERIYKEYVAMLNRNRG